MEKELKEWGLSQLPKRSGGLTGKDVAYTGHWIQKVEVLVQKVGKKLVKSVLATAGPGQIMSLLRP